MSTSTEPTYPTGEIDSIVTKMKNVLDTEDIIQVERLQDLLNDLAGAQVRADHAYIKGRASEDQAKARLRDLVAYGPNDTWSGRSNDLRRARFDALLALARVERVL